MSTDLGLIAKHEQELAAVQDRLSVLQCERELILEYYAKNQQACADAFNERIASGITYTVEGESTHYSVDFNTFPLLKSVQSKAADKLKNLTSFIEIIKTYSEDHPVRQAYEKNGIGKKPFLLDKLRIEQILSTMVQAIVQEVGGNDPKKAAMTIAKQFSLVVMPYQEKAFELDRALHQNGLSTSLMLAQQDVVHENIQSLSASTRLNQMG